VEHVSVLFPFGAFGKGEERINRLDRLDDCAGRIQRVEPDIGAEGAAGGQRHELPRTARIVQEAERAVCGQGAEIDHRSRRARVEAVRVGFAQEILVAAVGRDAQQSGADAAALLVEAAQRRAVAGFYNIIFRL